MDGHNKLYITRTNLFPSMRRLRGKIFYRLADKRSWEWWNYQESLLKLVREQQPDLVLVTGVLPLQKEFLMSSMDMAENCELLNRRSMEPNP